MSETTNQLQYDFPTYFRYISVGISTASPCLLNSWIDCNDNDRHR